MKQRKVVAVFPLKLPKTSYWFVIKVENKANEVNLSNDKKCLHFTERVPLSYACYGTFHKGMERKRIIRTDSSLLWNVTQSNDIFQGKDINTLPYQFSCLQCRSCKVNEPLMRNIESRKNHLLHLIFAFAFDAFLTPALTKRSCAEIWQNI